MQCAHEFVRHLFVQVMFGHIAGRCPANTNSYNKHDCMSVCAEACVCVPKHVCMRVAKHDFVCVCVCVCVCVRGQFTCSRACLPLVCDLLHSRALVRALRQKSGQLVSASDLSQACVAPPVFLALEQRQTD